MISLNFCFLVLQMGAYHTIDLEMNRKFTLGKSEWDSIALERIGKYNVTLRPQEAPRKPFTSH